MAPDQPQGDQAPSNLPAPYRNPWRALADDLQAVWADLGLRLRELWRRNREGDLVRPRWWPADLAPLFWPLVLAAGLALIAALLLLVAPRLKPAPAAPPAAPQTVPLQTAPLLEGPAEALPDADRSTEDELIPAPPEWAAKPGINPAEPESNSEVEPESEQEPEAEPVPVVDPLQLLIQRPEAGGLLRSAEGLPDQGRLLLRLAPSFSALSPAEQQRRANQWQQWAGELGCDHLELRDSRGGLLARDALVGEGMIVLESSPQS